MAVGRARPIHALRHPDYLAATDAQAVSLMFNRKEVVRMLPRICDSEIRPPLLFLICAALIGSSILGCSSDRNGALEPQFQPPGNGVVFSLDVNDDGVEDFIFEYI